MAVVNLALNQDALGLVGDQFAVNLPTASDQYHFTSTAPGQMSLWFRSVDKGNGVALAKAGVGYLDFCPSSHKRPAGNYVLKFETGDVNAQTTIRVKKSNWLYKVFGWGEA